MLAYRATPTLGPAFATMASHSGYYPDDETGRSCVRLLREAFVRGLLFCVGASATTGSESAICYAIHQKSRCDGGATNHSWPDSGYLDRLRSECAAHGILIEEMPPLDYVVTGCY